MLRCNHNKIGIIKRRLQRWIKYKSLFMPNLVFLPLKLGLLIQSIMPNLWNHSDLWHLAQPGASFWPLGFLPSVEFNKPVLPSPFLGFFPNLEPLWLEQRLLVQPGPSHPAWVSFQLWLLTKVWDLPNIDLFIQPEVSCSPFHFLTNLGLIPPKVWYSSMKFKSNLGHLAQTWASST